ncbi:hypothetical protein CC80DRAFT_552166 [Byssothecium circinans]|uniref:Uncharacterized protein n=1 Tax=Byssothecium circinans TaxID=147558 RepID=A0A6A5TLS3_9PLEO|nr:hypothetical protein CC80DRAFT_552166 [Byssothecium circinans]
MCVMYVDFHILCGCFIFNPSKKTFCFPVNKTCATGRWKRNILFEWSGACLQHHNLESGSPPSKGRKVRCEQQEHVWRKISLPNHVRRGFLYGDLDVWLGSDGCPVAKRVILGGRKKEVFWRFERIEVAWDDGEKEKKLVEEKKNLDIELEERKRLQDQERWERRRKEQKERKRKEEKTRKRGRYLADRDEHAARMEDENADRNPRVSREALRPTHQHGIQESTSGIRKTIKDMALSVPKTKHEQKSQHGQIPKANKYESPGPGWKPAWGLKNPRPSELSKAQEENLRTQLLNFNMNH